MTEPQSTSRAAHEDPSGSRIAVPMGGDTDPWAVVDSLGLVKGLTGLRVVDASVMPEIPSIITNLATTMLAESIF